MDRFYSLSGTKKVKTLETELIKELKDLNDEIEDAENLFEQGSKPFSSLPAPRDADYFRNERKVAFRKALKVPRAMPLTLKSDVMKLELKSASMNEYTKENIGIILHQFFTDRAQSLAYCKTMHMLRWARICRDSKTIESLYPKYLKRLENIIKEQQDAIQRSKRLSMCRDISKRSTSLKYVKPDDLLIYTRWLICHLHSLKHIHSFIRVIEWLPSTKRNQIQPEMDGGKGGAMKLTKSVEMIRLISRKISTAGRMFSHTKRRTATFSETNIPPAPHLTCEKQKPLVPSAEVSIISAACGGGLASNEVSLSIPVHDLDIASYAPVLNFLLSCYGIQMRTQDLKSRSDEMDMLHLVLRKFKSIYYDQEQLRHFPTYDILDDMLSGKRNEDNGMITFKKCCDWEDFIQIVPNIDGMEKKNMTMLKEKAFVDELLRIQSQFFHVSDSQRALSCLREHANCLGNQSRQTPISVTTNRTKSDTSSLWNRIFDYSSSKKNMKKKDPLNFDIKLTGDDIACLSDNDLDLSAAVELLGLEDDNEKKHPLINHGTFLSYLALRQLRIRDLQRTCLAVLNYFRSIERTLTIDDGGLVPGEDGFKLKRHSNERRSPLGIGSQQYMHNTPAEFRADEQEFLQSLELENQDDFYSMVDGRIHVQDSKGCYIMYDVALQDLKRIEQQLLLVGSHFISKYQTEQKGLIKNANLQGNDFDISTYSLMEVDRFGVLLDLWTNETAYLENKRKLVACHFELYQHVFDPEEKRAIAQIITDVVSERPRFDYSCSYFVQTYRSECYCLRLRLNIVETIANKQVDLQREYLQKIIREPDPTFGMPHRIIPVQNISLIESRPALKHVYLLEFHPSLSLLHKVTTAIDAVKQEFERIHSPKEPNQFISLERRLYEVILEEYQKLKPLGNDYSEQLQRDLFSETFMEDPLFVCTFGQSQMSAMNPIEKKRTINAEKESTILSWCKLLQIITLRHRLIECCDESSLLSPVYKQRAKELGFDECHLYMRAVSFEFAQKKPEIETKQVSTIQLIENDSWVDRYTPNTLSLAVHELDEKHIGAFSLRTHEGLFQLCQDASLEKLRTTLVCQVVHKNMLAASLLQIDSCLIFERKIGMKTPARAIEESTKKEDGERPNDPFASAKMLDAWRRKLQESFVSIQIEKFVLRNRMLNKFLDEKTAKGIIMNNSDEIIRVKRNMIGMFSEQLNERLSLHSLRSQIISCIFDLRNLLSGFPKTRDSHFMIGTEEDAKVEKDTEIIEDPAKFNRRPRRMISADGKSLANLWYLPHYKEVLRMFSTLNDDILKNTLSVMLHILSYIFEICQYLCAHAKLGSSQARLGSKKLQFSGGNADWGGSEGIGAELREIQQQINNLSSPKDPYLVATFLEKKRDVMFFEFDVAVSRSVRGTFLSAGNEQAFKSITQCAYSSLRQLSDIARPSVYSSGLSLPEPLFPEDSKAFELCPWRSFLRRYGPCPLLNSPAHKIEQIMLQCLADLKTIDRHVVNGEILSLSLLLEDVLAFGPIDVTLLLNSDRGDHVEPPESSSSSATSPKESNQTQEQHKRQRRYSTKSTPLEAIEYLHDFLLLYSTLEQAKEDWACRKLGISVLKSSRQYHALMAMYKSEVLQVVYKQIAAKQGKEKEYDKNFPIDDSDPLAVPSDVGEYEIKARQLVRLLESMECSMISDVIRRISREHTLVVAERSRDDPNLPTDLWKKSSLKENIVIARPHMVEDFYSKLMSDHVMDGDSIIFSKDHLEHCLINLASDTIQRERQSFESYTQFYEGILKKQHQTLYLTEQELKQAKSNSLTAQFNQGVDVDCLLADKCRHIILEITALRSRVSELTDHLTNQERELHDKFKQDYNSMVIELFNNAFNMRNRFEQFKSSLYDDVFVCLGEVRKLSVESMKKLREKFGQADMEAESLSQRLIRAEQLREAQWESKNLLNMILKLKALSHWNKTKTESKSLIQLGKLQQELSRSRREALEINLITEEKETLLKQEISSLRRALIQSEKDCHILRKKLSKEHKLKTQKSNTQLQEAFSQRKIDLAKTANIERLLQELEEKEEKLKVLSELTDRDNSVSRRSKVESKRLLKQVLHQLSHERSLKLDAFDRCDDLQRQVDEYEEQLEIFARPMSSQTYHASCFPTVPGGMSSPQRTLISARPHTHAAVRTYLRSKSSRSQNQSQNQWWTNTVSYGTAADGSKNRIKMDKVSQSIEAEKGNVRLKKKISETLLSDFEALDY